MPSKSGMKTPFKKLDGSQTNLSSSEISGQEMLLNKNFEYIKHNQNHKYNSNEMYLAESYEDILSTAIINKVLRWNEKLMKNTQITNHE